MGYEKRQFLYGMDFDTEERLVEQGFTRKNVNVRIGSSTDDGVLSAENIQGNTLIPNVELPTGDNKVIGSYWYKKKDLNYFFVWNENGEHGIYEYNHVSSKIERVLKAEVLNFQKDSLITGINVVEFDDSNDFLYWVDKANPPRKINIQKAKTDVYTTPIKEEVIDAIKYPPLCPPKATFESDSSLLANYFSDQIWQFKAAYVYDDKEVSAWSPISVQVLPGSSCSGDGLQGNTIRIVVPKGGELVERVKIAGRKGNIEDFKLVIDQDISDYGLDTDGNYVYVFKNDKILNNIEINQSNKLFDSLPQVAGAQEFIKNKIVYGDITEGYDNVDVDVKMDLSLEQNQGGTNTIKGYLRITGDYGDFQPITQNSSEDSSTTAFGGLNSEATGTSVAAGYIIGERYQQEIPLGGFVVYLAGTDYYDVSKQVLTGNAYQNTNTGVYRDGGNAASFEIIDLMSTPYSSGPYDSSVYSEWEIPNIPDGSYIIRVASNKTTSSDLNDPDRAYQRTSTYLNSVNYLGVYSPGDTQAIVKELEVTVQNGQIIDNIEIVIDDTSGTKTINSGSNRVTAGYIVNTPDNTYTPSTLEEALALKRVEKAEVYIGTFNNTDTPPTSIVDHNGFFYQKQEYISNTYFPIGVKVAGYYAGGFLGNNKLNTYNLKASNPPPQDNAWGEEAELLVFVVRDKQIFENAKATALVTVLDDNGSPVSGIVVASNQGDEGITDVNGQANISVYASHLGTVTFVSKRFYYYSGNSNCSITFDNQVISETFNVGPNNFNDQEPINPFVVTTVIAEIGTVAGLAYLKPGGVYPFGIVYYDRANRSGTTNKALELSIPFYTDEVNGVLFGDSKPSVNWSINNTPPEWATHYQIVRTKNTAVNNYLQWFPKKVEYKNSEGVITNAQDATIIDLDITNLSDEYKTANPDSVLVYDFTEGDRVRFIKDSAGNYFDSYIDVKVLGFQAGILQIDNAVALSNIEDGALFEIYTPKLDVDQDIYYEIGECYEIGETVDSQGNTIRIHKGPTQDQTDLQPATGTLIGGDTYFRDRSIPLDNSGEYITNIDSQLYSDFWQSNISDIGRPNVVSLDTKRVTRPTTIFHSANFVPETNINGLNSFFDTAFQTYDRHYGTIKKLFEVNGRLDVYHELKVAKVFVEESIVFNQSGQGNIGIANDVLSYPSQVYAGEYGMMNPESFVENEGRRYFFDVRNGAVLRLGGDGMTPISDNKMHSYFESKSNFYSAFDQVPEIWGTYDEDADEYIIAFGSIEREEGFTPDELALVSSQAETITEELNGLTYTFIIDYEDNVDGVDTNFDIVLDEANGTYVINSTAGDLTLDRQNLLAIPAETLGFSERTKHWTSFYTYTPECMGRVGINFLSFRNGRAFLHDQSAKRNTFYGSQNSSEVWVVFNQDPSNNKVYQSLSEESDTVWEAREIITQNGQKSNLILDDFAVDYGQGHTLYAKENIHYAALWRDENTPNVDLPLINGDNMRDVSILFKLINSSTEEERLYAASTRYSLSPRTNG